jgi:hypothetical protein
LIEMRTAVGVAGIGLQTFDKDEEREQKIRRA